jgi:hypothetical protein
MDGWVGDEGGGSRRAHAISLNVSDLSSGRYHYRSKIGQESCPDAGGAIDREIKTVPDGGSLMIASFVFPLADWSCRRDSGRTIWIAH